MTRSVWALLAVVWLNMAVMPCAMAFEAGDHDCPHCPPSDEHAGHHGHEQARNPCASMQSECCDIDEATLETRASKLKPSSDSFVAIAPAIVAVPVLSAIGAPSVDPPDPPGEFPPRHVLFCVYLD